MRQISIPSTHVLRALAAHSRAVAEHDPAAVVAVSLPGVTHAEAAESIGRVLDAMEELAAALSAPVSIQVGATIYGRLSVTVTGRGAPSTLVLSRDDSARALLAHLSALLGLE